MKLIIAGSRTINPTNKEIGEYLDKHNLLETEEIISGTANGVDKCGEKWANLHCTPVKRFPADWDKHGKAAGHIRNAEMAKYGDALLLIWDGSSRGSANMKAQMEKLGKPVYEVIIKAPRIVEEL